jgi:hypothetical protein
MATDITADPQGTPPEVMQELRKAAEYAAKGVRDPEVMRTAREAMDRLREKNQVWGSTICTGMCGSGVRTCMMAIIIGTLADVRTTLTRLIDKKKWLRSWPE